MFTRQTESIFVTAIILFVITPSAFAGKIVAWGNISPDVPAGNCYEVIAGGYRFGLALSSDGSMAGWGSNSYGQSSARAGNDFVAISCGYQHSLALRANGLLVGWGNVFYDTPFGEYVAIASGQYHNLAIKPDGSLIAWGSNNRGQCNVPGGNNYIAVSGGAYHSLVLRSDGTLLAWGYNNAGQLNVPAGNDFVAISAGIIHNLALRSDGTLAGWGYNDYGQSTVPDGNDYVAIATGQRHSLVLKSDGSLVAWGANWYGECDAPDGNDFIAIAAGQEHCLAIKKVSPPTVLDPNGTEVLITNTYYTINWEPVEDINNVAIEYSVDDGNNWTMVVASTDCNTGSYEWLVPRATSQQCLVRIADATYPSASDTSDAVFTIYECTVPDLTDDCYLNMADFAVFTLYWLQCGNPFDSNCIP